MVNDDPCDDYLNINRASWNRRTDVHFDSSFYDNETFLQGRSSLNDIELPLLGDLTGKKVLHLQCHFGQDTISLARLGAIVTGVDLSDHSITKARELAGAAGVDCEFVCCDLYDLPDHLPDSGQFDVVFTSYGTITWLPDLSRWAQVINRFLAPGGRLVFVDFHPVVWMFDDDFQAIKYRYFNSGPIAETEVGTYADKAAAIEQDYVTWNHAISEVLGSLLASGLRIDGLMEYDYSPYDVFDGSVEVQTGRYRVQHLGDRIPMVYSIVATRA